LTEKVNECEKKSIGEFLNQERNYFFNSYAIQDIKIPQIIEDSNIDFDDMIKVSLSMPNFFKQHEINGD
jgi:hypothetical protein